MQGIPGMAQSALLVEERWALTGFWLFSHGCSASGLSTVSYKFQMFGSLLGRSWWKLQRKNNDCLRQIEGWTVDLVSHGTFLSVPLSFHFVPFPPPWIFSFDRFWAMNSTVHPCLLLLGCDAFFPCDPFSSPGRLQLPFTKHQLLLRLHWLSPQELM